MYTIMPQMQLERKTTMSELKVGYCRKCITPKESVPLSGYGNSTARMSQSVVSDLFVTGCAFSDGVNPAILLFSIDHLMTKQSHFDPIRQQIAQEAGIPFDNVLFSATHTHSGPDLGADHESIVRYVPFMTEQILSCARETLADLKPATISIASNKSKYLSCVRHYMTESGEYRGVNLNVYHESPIAYCTSEPDPHIQLVKFARTGGKDVIIANWQTHPHLTGFGKADLSSDFIGVMRDEMEAALDCNFVYFSGASGNLTINNFNKKLPIITDYLEHGKELARLALEALPKAQAVEAGPVELVAHYQEETLNPPPDEETLARAKDVLDFFTTNKNYKESILYSESRGLHSQYQASYMIIRKQRYDEGDTQLTLPMYAFRVGDIGFITAPYEMFDTNGKYIRDFSPFAATIVATCANDYKSYIPSAYGYLNECYEADTAVVAPGTGERLAQKYVKMLESLKPEV